MSRKERRALASIAKRLTKAVKRAQRTKFSEDSRVHAASLWKRYSALTGDTRPL